MWRDGQSDLARRLEMTGGRGRQFVVRRRILVIQVAVNDHLIAEPLVIEGRKSTIVFNRVDRSSRIWLKLKKDDRAAV